MVLPRQQRLVANKISRRNWPSPCQPSVATGAGEGWAESSSPSSSKSSRAGRPRLFCAGQRVSSSSSSVTVTVRRHLIVAVASLVCLLIISRPRNGRTPPATAKPSVPPKDEGGNRGALSSPREAGDVPPRRTSNLSDYYFSGNDAAADDRRDGGDSDVRTPMTAEEARRGREEILSILEDAGIRGMGASEIAQLPLWRQVQELYYRTNGNLTDESPSRSATDGRTPSFSPGPVILGLDTCQSFRRAVPQTRDRYIGIAGNFNTGTTAFGLALQANCRFPDHPTNRSNHVVLDVNGMLNQVPWAKHKMARYRDSGENVIHNDIAKDHVLPVVMVRDPFFWMQSMCRQGYGVRWDHDPNMHCPNLIPNDFDRKRFKKKNRKHQQAGQQSQTDASVTASPNSTRESVRVWMGANRQSGPSWDSLVHYWNEWYESYLYQNVNNNNNNNRSEAWPRLIVRFEDALFYPKQVTAMVCECGGGQLSPDFSYLLGEAKWNHNHAQNNFVSAMVHYGADEGGRRRYRNMTRDDIDFAQKTLNPNLMEAFRYRY